MKNLSFKSSGNFLIFLFLVQTEKEKKICSIFLQTFSQQQTTKFWANNKCASFTSIKRIQKPAELHILAKNHSKRNKTAKNPQRRHKNFKKIPHQLTKQTSVSNSYCIYPHYTWTRLMLMAVDGYYDASLPSFPSSSSQYLNYGWRVPSSVSLKSHVTTQQIPSGNWLHVLNFSQ